MNWLSKVRFIPICVGILLFLFTGDSFAQNLTKIQNQVKVNYQDTIGKTYSTSSNMVITPLYYTDFLWVKKYGPNEVIPGEIATYTITYGNNGSMTIYGVKLSDKFPTQMESLIYQDSGYFLTIDPITKYGTWNIDILPPGTYSFKISIKIGRDVSSSTSIVNFMKIESKAEETYLVNNYSTATTNVRIPNIDLWLAKQGPNSLLSGGIATYTITYGNKGTKTAVNVKLIDQFQEQIQAIVYNNAGLPFEYGTLTKRGIWSITNLSPGTYSFKLAVKLKDNIPGSTTMVNTIKIAYPGAETDYTNNQATATIHIIDANDVAIWKYGPAEVACGQEFEYRIIYRNLSKTPAENVQITDILPEGLIYLSDTLGGSRTNNIIRWNIGTLSPWSYNEFRLKVKVQDNAKASSTITNIIEITTSNPDIDTSNNKATVSTHICLPEPKLKIYKWQHQNKVTAGQMMDYYIRYSNEGKGNAGSVTITDTLPIGVSYVSDDSGFTHHISGSKVIWQVETLSANQSKNFKLKVLVDKYTPASTTLTNIIEISTPYHQTSDRYTCTTHVKEPITDVLVYKFGPDEVLYGTEFTYEITYNNNSVSDADGVVIKDILDPQLRYKGDTSGITPTISGNEISWYIGTMSPWASGHFLLKVEVPYSVPASSTLTNVVEITTLTSESKYNNNRATLTTHVVTPKVDVGIEKKGDDARGGFNKRYHITYYNQGTEKAKDVVIIDKLPPQVQYLSSDPAGIYNSASHTVTWNIGELDPQTTRYATIDVKIPPTQQCGINLYNYIEIITTSQESDYTNNKFTEIETVVSSIDPNDKLVSPQKYIRDNELLNYTIRFENQATATASAILITIEDQLPPNLDWTSMKFGQIKIGTTSYTLANFDRGSLTCSYDVGSGTIRWEFDFKTGANGLPPNVISPEGEGYVSFSINAKSGLPAGTEITNLATIRFDYNDPTKTPAVTNIVDLNKPTSKVKPLPAMQGSSSFLVSWSGTDTAGNKAGEIENYTIYVSDNYGTWTKWLEETSAESGTFTGQTGHRYQFYAVAKDRAKNDEVKTPTAEAETFLDIPKHFVITTLTPTGICAGGTVSMSISIYNNNEELVTDYVGTATLRDKLGVVGYAIFNGTDTWTGVVTIPQIPNGGTNNISVAAEGVTGTVSETLLMWLDRYVGGTVTLWIQGVGTTTIRFGTSTFNQDFYIIINPVTGTKTMEGCVVDSAREIIAYNAYVRDKQLTGTFTNLTYLEIPYLDTNQDGFVDGTYIDEKTLWMYVWQDGQWQIIEDSGRNTERNIVWCNINHLSTFMPIGILVAPSTLGNVAVYPNPYKPNSGLGHEYITFGSKRDISRRLTSYATIKIYTVSGELVKTLEVTPQDNGQKIWYADNDAGNKVASGVYIYLITNPQGEKCIGKLAIIR